MIWQGISALACRGVGCSPYSQIQAKERRHVSENIAVSRSVPTLSRSRSGDTSVTGLRTMRLSGSILSSMSHLVPIELGPRAAHGSDDGGESTGSTATRQRFRIGDPGAGLDPADRAWPGADGATPAIAQGATGLSFERHRGPDAWRPEPRAPCIEIRSVRTVV
jgi:hypothetical protein